MEKLFNAIKKFLNGNESLKRIDSDVDTKIEKFKNIKFNKIVMDSKKIEENDIFFAINNGNNYVEEALEKQASLVFCDKKQIIKSDKIIYVENTVSAMQQIANLYRKEANFKIIGITGSNGKTTTKDILYSVLSQKFKVEKTQGNYNNHIGLPFTILTTNEDTQYLILEMGMSSLGEIDLLCKVAEPDYGIITNIGLSHMEILKTKENVFKAKTEMLKYVGAESVFLSSDDEFLVKVSGNKIGFNPNVKTDGKCKNYVISNFVQDENRIIFSMNGEEFSTNLNGEYNANNCGLVIALAKKIGLSSEEIKMGLRELSITPMRFQKVYWKDILVINDAYNASPISMELGLKSFAQIYKERYKIAFIGDMLELGEKEIDYHEDAIKQALSFGYQEIILYGDRMEKALENLKKASVDTKKVLFFKDKEDIKNIILSKEKLEIVLFIKGSRGMKLEDILKAN
ncbi:MAG: UDP-N-acetylmuramoyl-tripeptide--D-alanyl-D-alanine ligase [Fusobacteriaceae bacterium]